MIKRFSIDLLVTLAVGYAVGLAAYVNGLVMMSTELINAVTVTLLGIIWIVIISRRSRPVPPLLRPMLALGIALSLASLFSIAPRQSIIVVGYWAMITVVYWAAEDLTSTQQGQRRLETAVLVSFSALVLLGLYQAWLLWFQSGFTEPPPRIPSTTGNPNIFGTILVLMIAICLHRYHHAKSTPERALMIGWTAVTLLALLLTGSRASLAGVTVGIGVYLTVGFLLSTDTSENGQTSRWFQLRQYISAHTRGILIGATAIILAIVLIGPFIGGNVLGRFSRDLLLSALEVRGLLWARALTIWWENPLLGSGPLTYGTQLFQVWSVPPLPL
ncbi:MAG: hypothetical protein GYB68_02365, partial [Chloroflexi bacterium]|nr:hypothetical protein [Chloroflexota bacterium]